MKSLKGLVTAALAGISFAGHASILPPNDLHLQDGFLAGGLTEKQFNDTIDFVEAYYAPIVASFKGELKIDRKWDDTTVNAYANRSGSVWNVAMFGGLARRPEVTVDGFALVVCHELGHHIAGFPFYSRDWAADEGQSDYFATQACGRNLWKTDFAVNATFAEKVNKIAKEKCDANWDSSDDRNLCYRISNAGFSLATLLGALGGQVPDFAKPDTTKVVKTNHNHPKAQCRLDTYLAGGLCTASFDDTKIPGVSPKLSEIEKEKEALAVSCSQFDVELPFAGRPACWFKETADLK
jgi:hypothetical protein